MNQSHKLTAQTSSKQRLIVTESPIITSSLRRLGYGRVGKGSRLNAKSRRDGSEEGRRLEVHSNGDSLSRVVTANSLCDGDRISSNGDGLLRTIGTRSLGDVGIWIDSDGHGNRVSSHSYCLLAGATGLEGRAATVRSPRGCTRSSGCARRSGGCGSTASRPARVGVGEVGVDQEHVVHLLGDGPIRDILVLDERARTLGALIVAVAGRSEMELRCIAVRINDGDVNHTGIYLGSDNILSLGIVDAVPRSLSGLGGKRGPVPDPVEGVCGVDVNVVGNADIDLAPESSTLKRIGGLGELGLASSGNFAVVFLMALAVVVVSSGNQAATTITTSSLGVPDTMDTEELVVVLGLRGAVDEDGAAVERLIGLVVGKRHMSILLITKSNQLARSSLDHGEFVGVVADRVFGYVVVVSNNGATGPAVRWKKVNEETVIETGVIAVDHATRVTGLAD